MATCYKCKATNEKSGLERWVCSHCMTVHDVQAKPTFVKPKPEIIESTYTPVFTTRKPKKEVKEDLDD